MGRKFSQFSEADALKTVIIGRWEGYRRVEAYTEIVNKAQRGGLPEIDTLKKEFEGFQKTLEKHGVETLIPDYVGKFVYDQLTPRDIAVVIGSKLILCNMVKRSRKYEVAGIFPHLSDFSGEEPDVLIPPPDALLEGGDIIVDKGRILVGISQRTNIKGFQWLEETFGKDFEIVPLYTKTLSESENVLHLDCTFNPVGDKGALIYASGFKSIPSFLKNDYDWIEVDKNEQEALATNVLSLSKKTIIARDYEDCKRINGRLRESGFEVEEIPFDGAPATGGSFRCCSMPLVRG